MQGFVQVLLLRSYTYEIKNDTGILVLKLIPMKTYLLLIVTCCTYSVQAQTENFSSRVVATGLSNPWEVTMGPDNFLWVTERTGKRITRVDPVSGAKATAITITEVYQTAGQDGLLGMALHPDLLAGTGNDFVFVAYTYDADASGTINRKTKIVRYTFDALTKTLSTPVNIITGLPASNDHNSGRLIIGPDNKLYYTIGDMGANQFGNKCVAIRAQDLPTAAEIVAQNWIKYQGKILRLEMNGAVPADNPLLAGVRSHIYSYGHRNAQGLAFAPDGKLYANEHGPKTDDEINLIHSGKNYGWPFVAGFKDNQAYVYGNWSGAPDCSSLTFSDYTFPATVPQTNESAFTATDFVPPMKTLFTVDNSYNFQDAECSGNYFMCWPTIGPSSLDIYTTTTGGIPGWANSLLAVSLKKGKVYRLKLSTDGNTITADTIGYFHSVNRYRDIAIGTNHTSFYISTDNTGSTSGPTSGYTSTLANPGAILEYQYLGIVLDLKDNVIERPVIKPEIKLYPNPVVNTLYVKAGTNRAKPLSVQVYNTHGVLIKHLKLVNQPAAIEMFGLPAGMYLVKIMNRFGQTVLSKTIVRQ